MNWQILDFGQVVEAAFDEVDSLVESSSDIRLNLGENVMIEGDLPLLIRAVSSLLHWCLSVKSKAQPLKAAINIRAGTVGLAMSFLPLIQALARSKTQVSKTISLQSSDQLLQESLYLAESIIQSHNGKLSYSLQSAEMLEVSVELPSANIKSQSA